MESERLTMESIERLKACDSYTLSTESTGYAFAYGFKNDNLEVVIHANSEAEIRQRLKKDNRLEDYFNQDYI